MKTRTRQDGRTSLLTQGGVQTAVEEGEYCNVDACYRAARSTTYCDTHYRNKLRTGSVYGVKSTKEDREWVMESAGAVCGVCGRSVYGHKVTEFCELIARMA